MIDFFEDGQASKISQSSRNLFLCRVQFIWVYHTIFKPLIVSLIDSVRWILSRKLVSRLAPRTSSAIPDQISQGLLLITHKVILSNYGLSFFPCWSLDFNTSSSKVFGADLSWASEKNFCFTFPRRPSNEYLFQHLALLPGICRSNY